MQKELISEISSPLVSFIITTSNHQKEYLVECINSILQLSLNAKEREIILVDDGSDELVASQIKELLDNLRFKNTRLRQQYGTQLWHVLSQREIHPVYRRR